MSRAGRLGWQFSAVNVRLRNVALARMPDAGEFDFGAFRMENTLTGILVSGAQV
jgi:hypothetical protein